MIFLDFFLKIDITNSCIWETNTEKEEEEIIHSAFGARRAAKKPSTMEVLEKALKHHNHAISDLTG